jgi:hypothetical protein
MLDVALGIGVALARLSAADMDCLLPWSKDYSLALKGQEFLLHSPNEANVLSLNDNKFVNLCIRNYLFSEFD